MRAKRHPSAKKSKLKPDQPSRHDRFFKEEGADQRDPFERDRDRVLYSAEFRRLAGVTQVVHVEEGHVFHNRLTHSIKVAQIARRLAEHLLKVTPREVLDAAGGLDPSVSETAALCHDIGHPPFGHIAEEELDKLLVKECKCQDGFEGNAQSFRIVNAISIRSEADPGLNLTRATLNAILKYPWRRAPKGKENRKWGFFSSEHSQFEFARVLNPTGDKRKSLEAEIMDLADDVAYSVHDVDDFYRAGLVPFHQLLRPSNERSRFFESALPRLAEKRNIKISEKHANAIFDDIGGLVRRGLEEPFTGSKSQRAALNTISTILIRRFTFGPDFKSTKVSTREDQSRLKVAAKILEEILLFKEIMGFYVYANPALLGQQHGQRKVVRELFRELLSAVESTKGFSILPEPFQSYLFDCDGTLQSKGRLISDFIASLTEQQALNFHKRLTGLAPGSVRELIVRY